MNDRKMATHSADKAQMTLVANRKSFVFKQEKMGWGKKVKRVG